MFVITAIINPSEPHRVIGIIHPNIENNQNIAHPQGMHFLLVSILPSKFLTSCVTTSKIENDTSLYNSLARYPILHVMCCARRNGWKLWFYLYQWQPLCKTLHSSRDFQDRHQITRFCKIFLLPILAWRMYNFSLIIICIECLIYLW